MRQINRHIVRMKAKQRYIYIYIYIYIYNTHIHTDRRTERKSGWVGAASAGSKKISSILTESIFQSWVHRSSRQKKKKKRLVVFMTFGVWPERFTSHGVIK